MGDYGPGIQPVKQTKEGADRSLFLLVFSRYRARKNVVSAESQLTSTTTSQNDMSFISDLLHTRLAVHSLSQEAGWVTPIGASETDILSFVLPRTAPTATIRLGCAIACHKHDEAVGQRR